jgi:hypothetical protein
MFESRLLTDRLDALVRVMEAESGYRDNWWIWLAGIGEHGG